MTTIRTFLALAAAGAAVLAVAAQAAAHTPTHESLVIRHQVHGCHAWSVNGGPFAASQTTTVARGGRITLTNNDVMLHRLVQTSGPAVSLHRVKRPMMGVGLQGTFGPAMLAHMGAAVNVIFTQPGVYRFTTKFGEDYPGMQNMKTVGEDNVLHLTVTVP